MKLNLKSKTVIITGGTSGIGKACATIFAQHGANVIITGRDESRLAQTKAELLTQNITIYTYKADVSRSDENIAMAEYALQQFGQIDILINNAGISMRALFETLDLSIIERVMNINFWGTVYATHACLPAIIKSKGSVIGISSIAGYRGLPARTGYSASKFAMQGFLESLRTELLNTGVHVMVACPGFTASNIRNTALVADGSTQSESPLEETKIMSADAVAKIIFDATIQRKREVIMTAQGKLTVLLNKLFPAFMDQMVYNHFKKEPNSPIK